METSPPIGRIQSTNIAALAQHRGLSSATLFIDMRSAFHFLIREQMFGFSTSLPHLLRDALRNLQIDPDIVEDAIPVLSQRFQSEARPLLQRLMSDAHQSTAGFTCRALRPMGNHSGFKAGLTHCRPRLEWDDLRFTDRSGGCFSHVPCPSTRTSPSPTGYPYSRMGRRLSQLEPAVLMALSAVQKAASRRGMSLNLAAGKTECVCVSLARTTCSSSSTRTFD